MQMQDNGYQIIVTFDKDTNKACPDPKHICSKTCRDTFWNSNLFDLIGKKATCMD